MLTDDQVDDEPAQVVLVDGSIRMQHCHMANNCWAYLIDFCYKPRERAVEIGKQNNNPTLLFLLLRRRSQKYWNSWWENRWSADRLVGTGTSIDASGEKVHSNSPPNGKRQKFVQTQSNGAARDGEQSVAAKGSPVNYWTGGFNPRPRRFCRRPDGRRVACSTVHPSALRGNGRARSAPVWNTPQVTCPLE